uniref:RRM domain-containing protein n=1 Tax=Alexandrium monilatum TaxID=311494 RepID=A0A7S4QLL6_9DINO
MATGLRLTEPRLQPSRNTFMDEACGFGEMIFEAQAKVDLQPPVGLIECPTKCVKELGAPGKDCKVTAARPWPIAAWGGGRFEPQKGLEAENQKSASAFLSSEESAAEEGCLDGDSTDAPVAWPDTDDEDGDGLSFGGGACPHWSLGVQDARRASAPQLPGSACQGGQVQVPLGGVADMQNRSLHASSVPVSPHAGGFASPWSPARAAAVEQVRFWPLTSPAASVGGDNLGESPYSPGADRAAYLQALRRARDGATVSHLSAMQLPPAPVSPELVCTSKVIGPGDPLSPAAHVCPPQSIKAVGVVGQERSHAAGAAPSSPADRPAHVSTAAEARAAQRHKTISDDHEGSVTTLMVRNLPLNLSQQRFMEELDATGFADLYDFCYSPLCSLDSGRGKGFAFVNFVAEENANHFAATWHGTRRFGVQRTEPALNISAAAIQGKEANLANCGTKRAIRIRNPKLRPFVRD